MSVAVRNHVTVSGAPERRPMLFVHGLVTGQEVWRSVAPAFQADHRVVLFDHVGFGRSDRNAFEPSRYSSMHAYAADVLEICAELELEDVVVVAHSAGAMVAMLAAIEEPERFAALAMLGPSPRYLDDEGYHGGFTRQRIAGFLDAMERNYPAWCATASQAFLGHRIRPELADQLAEQLCGTDPFVARQTAEAVLLSDHRADVERVAAPCLIVHATEDMIAPREVAEYLHARLPDSELVTLQGAGHFPQLTAPADTIVAIHDFVSRRVPELDPGDADGHAAAPETTPRERCGLAARFELTPFGHVITGLDWRIRQVNAALLAWVGRDRDELVGRRFSELLTDAGQAFHEAQHAPLVTTEGMLREIAMDLARADGSSMPVLVSSVVGEWPDTVPAIRTTLLDAARRHQYEDTLLEAQRRAAARLRRLQQAVADLAGASTVSQIALVLPDALQEAFGATTTALWVVDPTEERLVEVVPETPPARRRIDVDDPRTESRALHTPEVITDPERRLVATAARHRGRGIGVLVIEVPDAERFEAEERELLRTFGDQVGQALDRAQAYEEKDRLLSVVSHELRTPLTPIIGFTEIVLSRSSELPDEVRHHLEVVRRNAHHLLRVVDGLLGATRSRRGLLEAAPELVELAPWLRHLLEELDAADVEIERLDEDAVVRADPGQLGRVVANLLSNARRYGRPPIGLSVTSEAVVCRVVVSDTGEGVPERFVPSLFDEFTQADAGDARSSTGLGLGLAIARDLVVRNGGELTYERGRPSGSRFVVTLPRARPANHAATAEAEEPPPVGDGPADDEER